MNGASAELFATTRIKPMRTSVITIGASQNFLFSRMNCQSSFTTKSFDINTSFRNGAYPVVALDMDANTIRLFALAGATDPSPLLS